MTQATGSCDVPDSASVVTLMSRRRGGAGAGVNLSRNTERCCGADPISNLTFLSYTFATTTTTTHAATELQLGSGPGECSTV